MRGYIDDGCTLLIFTTILSLNVAVEHYLQDGNRSCIQAEEQAALTNQSYCHPLITLEDPFCSMNGFKLDKYVNASGMQFRNDILTTFPQAYAYAGPSNISVECLKQFYFFGCYYSFPSCDRTTSVLKPKKICKETCLQFFSECSAHINDLKGYYWSEDPQNYILSSGAKDLFKCMELPSVNAGDTVECIAYAGKHNLESQDCLYLNGSNYHGNISVTASGIQCQLWTEQCPHRHTMNTTYPELNNASNHCRNPHNSGQRPWCFTKDRNKRWEYCNIPKCTPAEGNYGNWSLRSTCNVTCDQGFETWTRDCNNPKPEFGGRNCSHLGESVEYRQCKRAPCVVNGGYGDWNISSHCNATCGQGIEIWHRLCNNPISRNGGQNCSVLGKDMKYKSCQRLPCPIDGNYGNWTRSSSCSVKCGVGYETWSRKCNNPPPKYGGNCSKYGRDRENRPCHMETCQETSKSKVIRITCGVCASAIVIAIAFLIFKRKYVIRLISRRNSFHAYEEISSFTQMNKTDESIDEIDRLTSEPVYESIDGLNRTTAEESVLLRVL